MVGMQIPLLPLAHQYVKTTAVPQLAGPQRTCRTAPACRSCVTRTRTCTTASTATATASATTATGRCRWSPPSLGLTPEHVDEQHMPSRLDFTPEDFEPAWQASQELLPALRDSEIADGFNGIFSFTPDGGSIVGQSPRRRRLLDRRGGLGHPLGRHRPRGRGGPDHRTVPDRPRRVRGVPLRGRPVRPLLRRGDLPAELRRDLRHPAPAAAEGVSPRACGSARSTPASASWAPSSSKAEPGSGRTGTSPTPPCSTSCPPSGSRSTGTPGRPASTPPSPPSRPGRPAPPWRCTT